MKFVSIVICFMATQCVCCQSHRPTSAEPFYYYSFNAQGLKGAVRKVSTVVYELQIEDDTLYDEITSSCWIVPACAVGTLHSRHEISYGKTGEPDHLSVFKEGGEDRDVFFEYCDGRLEKIISGNTKYIYEYDTSGKLDRLMVYRNSNETHQWNYRYNNRGMLAEEEGKSIRKTIYAYDSLDRLMRVVKTTRKNLKSTTDYRYDASGRLIEERFVGHRGDSSRSFIEYRGTIKVIKEQPSGIESTYLEGLLVKSEMPVNGHSPEKYIITITYEFDDHGNWIKRTERDGKIAAIQERAISYYE